MKATVLVFTLLEACILAAALVSAAPNHGHRHRYRRVGRTSRSNVSSTTSHNTAKVTTTYTSTPSIVLVRHVVEHDILFTEQKESETPVARKGGGRKLNESSEDRKVHRNGKEDYEGTWDGMTMGWTAVGLFVAILLVG